MSTSAAIAYSLLRRAFGRRARPSVRPPHRLGGAHRRGALSSSRRAPLNVLHEYASGPSGSARRSRHV